MIKSRNIMSVATIVFLAMAMLFLGYGVTFSDVYAETTGPEINYTINETGWSGSKTITITVDSAAPITGVTIKGIDASDYLLLPTDDYHKEYLYTATISEDIIISATDSDNETNTATISAYELYIDNATPVFTTAVTGTVNDWTGKNVSLTFTQSGTVSSGYTYYYSKDGGGYIAVSGNTVSYNASSLNGTYRYRAVSGSGVVYDYPDSYEIKIDKTAPQAPVANFKTSYYTDLNVAFNLTLNSDNLSPETVYYTWDGSRPNTSSNTLLLGSTSILFPANGTYAVRLLAIDAVGNEGSVRTYLVKVDSTDYTVTFNVNPLGGGTVQGGGIYKRGDIVELTATAAEGYIFRDISNSGTTVSYESAYIFEIDGSGDQTFTANFIKILNITCANLTFTYDGAPKPITVEDDSGTDLSAFTQILYNGSSGAPVNAGIYDITVIIDHEDYYGYKEFSQTINKALAAIDVNPASLTQIYGNIQPVDVTITTPSSGAVLEILYNGSTSLPVNVGIYDITIIVISDNYSLTDTSYQLEIKKAAVTIILSDKTVIYNGGHYSVNPAITVPGNLSLRYEYYSGGDLMGSLPQDAGTYTVKAFFDGNSNYEAGVSNTATLIIEKKQLGISGTAIEQVKVYDGNNSANVISAGTLIGVVAGDNVSVLAVASYNDKYVLTANTITAVFTLSGTKSTNYIKPANLVLTHNIDGDVKITKRQLIISAPTVTSTKTYDGTTSAAVIAGNFTNLVTGDDVSVDASAAYNVKDITADTITVIYSIAGVHSDNYQTPLSEQHAGVINPKQLTVSDTDLQLIRTYDGLTDAEVLSVGTLNGVVGTEDVGFSVAAAYNSKNVKEAHTVTAVYTLIGTEKGNYLTPVNLVVTDGIGGKTVRLDPLQLSAKYSFTDTKVYDGTTDAASAFLSFDNAILDDDISASASASYNSKDVLTANTITISFSISGNDKDNYLTPINCTEGGFITPLKIVMNAPIYNNPKVYDRSDDATDLITNSGAGNIIGEDIVFVTHTAKYNSRKVLEADTITVSFAIDGADKANYSKPDDYIINDVEILPLQLVVDGTLSVDKEKVYDAGTSASIIASGNLANVIAEDTVGFTLTANYNTKNTTANQITVVYTLDGLDKDNYKAPIDELITDGISITPYQLSIENPVVNDKVYDGNTASAVTVGNLIDLFAGDNVVVTASGTFNSKHVLNAINVTVIYNLTGADAINYTLASYIASAKITPRQLIMPVPILTAKTYDGNTEAKSAVNIGAPANKITGDTVTLDYTANYDSAKVTEVTKVTVAYTITGGAEGSNYSAPDSYDILNAKIKAKQLTAGTTTFVSRQKVYDGTTAAAISQIGALSGIVGADTVTLRAEANYNSKQVNAANKIITAYTIEGADAGNYVKPINQEDTGETVRITPLQLTITDPTVSLTKVYDGRDNSVMTIGALVNKVAGDKLSVTAEARFNTPNVGANTVTVVYTIGDVDMVNYIKPANKIYNTGVSITPLAVSVTYSDLLYVYNGNAKAAAVVIDNYDSVKHLGFKLNLLYRNQDMEYVTNPTNAGTYTVSIDMTLNTNYTCTITAELVINPAESVMSVSDVFVIYSGISPQIPATVTNNEGDIIGGVEIVFTYYLYKGTIPWEEVDWENNSLDDFEWEEIIGEPPARAGCYKVTGSMAVGSNYSAAESSALLKISKKEATVAIDSNSLTQTYGSVTGVIIITNPDKSEGNPIQFIALYDNSADMPEDAGTYTVSVTLNDYNYYGSTGGTFTINPRSADNDIVIEKVNSNIEGDMASGFSIDYSSYVFKKTDFKAYVDVEGLEDLTVDISFRLNNEPIIEIKDAGLYQVRATINSKNISGISNVIFTINKVGATVSHTPQTFTYTGGQIGASGEVTEPYGRGVIYTYSFDDGKTFVDTPPVNVGTYQIKLVINDVNYHGETVSSMTITKANTRIILSLPIERTYTGSEIDLTGIVSFSGDAVEDHDVIYQFKKDDIAIEDFPVNSGTYTMQVSFVNRDNFIWPDTGFVNVLINKATPIITLEDGTYPFDGTQKTLPATIIPSIVTDITFYYFKAVEVEGEYIRGDEIFSMPSEVGIYIVVASIEDGGENFTGAISNDAVMIINQGQATVTAVDLSLYQSYDGNIKTVEVTTDPKDLKVIFEFRQNGTLVDPIDPGEYAVTATIDDATYQGFATFNLTITKCNIYNLIAFEGDAETVFDGKTKTLVPKAEGYSVNFLIKYNDTSSLPKNAGTYKVSAVIEDRYYMGSAITQLVIKKKEVTISAADITVMYGVEPQFQLTYAGFIAGEDKNILTRPPKIRYVNDQLALNTDEFGKDIIVGTYMATPENANAQNYSFKYIGGTLTVTKNTLKVKAVSTQVLEGNRALPNIIYEGFKYSSEDVNTVFGINRPIIKYYENETTLSPLLPITPGVYKIIPDGGICTNYNLVFEPAFLIVQNKVISSTDSQMVLDGAFHPNTIIALNSLEKGTADYKGANKALRDESIILLLKEAYEVDINIEGISIANAEFNFRMLIPEKLKGKDFKMFFMTVDGKIKPLEYTIDGDYAVGKFNQSKGTIIFTKSINVMLILIVIGGLVLVFGLYYLSKYLKKMKEESPKVLSAAIAPVVVAPLEALEDEDSAFDAYIAKMVEENAEKAEAEKAEQEEKEIDKELEELGINPDEYTPEEIENLKEKARKAKHLSVEQRITEVVEKQLVESFSETKKDISFQEFIPKASTDEKDEEDMSDEYIIENELYPNSNTISMEEAQALYPGRGIRRYNGKVALEVCFESALNLTSDKYKYIYSEIKNTFNSYLDIESRLFKSGEAYKGGNAHAVIRMRNECPVLYMNIDRKYIPEDAVYTDRSDEPRYKDMPIELIVDNGKQLTAARKMINAMMIVGGLNRNPDYRYVNYINKYPNIENAIIDET